MVVFLFVILKINGWITGLFASAMLANLFYVMRKHVLLTLPSSIQEAWLDEAGFWNLLYNNGQLDFGRINGDSYISPFLLVLNFTLLRNGRIKSLVLLPDMLSAQEWRRLRVFIRAEGL